MLWRREKVTRRAIFHNFTLPHHDDVVAHLPDHRQIVRDEQVGEAKIALQTQQQVENPRLHRNIKGGSCFVEDQQLGFDGNTRIHHARFAATRFPDASSPRFTR